MSDEIKTTSPIGHKERRLLEALDELGGTQAKHVARQTGWGLSLRVGSQLTRIELDRLCERGFAARMDDQKPICWLRTRAGTEALQHVPA